MSDLHGGSAAEPPTNPLGPPRYPVVAERHHPQATGNHCHSLAPHGL